MLTVLPLVIGGPWRKAKNPPEDALTWLS